MATRINETDKGFHASAKELEVVKCPARASWPAPASAIADRMSVATNWLNEVQSYNDVVYLTKNFKNASGFPVWIAVEKAMNNEFGEVAP